VDTVVDAYAGPWPEGLLAFEPMWARLAEHSHLAAIDLPGFGHSPRGDALLSPRAMGEFIIRAADAFELASTHIGGPELLNDLSSGPDATCSAVP
jgi:pimeloyl-ACP methyl ester carboxylesterase